MNIQGLDAGSILTRAATLFPKKTAIVFEQSRISYAELNERVNRLANGLLKMGVKKGDRVALLFFNSPQFIESYYAAVKIGAIVVPLNFRLAIPELAYEADNSDCKLIIYSAEFSEVMDKLRPRLSKVKSYICRGETLPHPDTADYEKLLDASDIGEPRVDVNMHDGCDIFYTGGTTGLPKGAYRTHENVIWIAITCGVSLKYKDDNVILASPPLFHIVSNYLTLSSFFFGSTIILAKAFDPAKAVETIQREKVTHVWLVPAMSTAIWSLPDIDKYDLSSLRVYTTGGAPMPTGLKMRIKEHLPNVYFTESYGSTETGWIASQGPVGAPWTEGQGNPCIFQKVRLVDDDNKEVPQGDIGEVVVQGPLTIGEYYNDPKMTAETIRDGWFHTGDLAVLDEDGGLHIVDRKKDMVISGGENVYSVEVERVILMNPKVLETAVIGLPHEKWGEQVTAVIVLKPGEEMTEDELTAFCRKELAGYKCPKGVKFLTEPLPRTSFGKVLKRELRDRFC
jgi:fatty-acyl-CoA synthase